MPKPSVTVVRCRVCQRVEGITSENDRFWCAWCQNWVAVDTVAVSDAVLIADGNTFCLAPAPIPPQPPDWMLPLRISAGWLIQWNTLSDSPPEEGERNLFLATNEHARRVIDVDSRNGVFRLRVFPLVVASEWRRGEPLETDWDNPLHIFETASAHELAAELEICLYGQRA